MDIARQLDFLLTILKFHTRQLLSFHRFSGVFILYPDFGKSTRGTPKNSYIIYIVGDGPLDVP